MGRLVHRDTLHSDCAGPAADLLCHGGFTDTGASGDPLDIEALTSRASLEPYLTTAREILAGYPAQFRCITSALRESLDTMEERDFGSTGG